MTGVAPPAPRAPVAPAFLVLFASLYAVQGVTVAYVFNFNKAYLQSFRLREDTIGTLQTLVLLPFALKFLVGPVSDRWNLFGRGHRLPYIVLGLVVQAAGLAGQALVDPGRSLGLFAGLAVLTVVGLAIYDTCCDGLVVDVAPAESRARVQALLWTSRFVAATVFTLAFGAALKWLGGESFSDRLLFASAALTLPPAALALSLREPPRAADAERFDWSALRVMGRPWSLALLTFGGLYGLAGMGVESNLSPFYDRLHFDSGDIGVIGACRNLGRAVGALALPLAVARLPRGWVLVIGVAGLAAAVAAQSYAGNVREAAVLGLAFGVAMGWDDTLFSFLAMEAADPRLAASTFALFMAITNLSVVGDALFSHGVVATRGYHRPFLAAALLTFATLPLARPLSKPAPAPNPPSPSPEPPRDVDDRPA